MKNWDVFCIFLIVRLASVFLVQTFFVPDEYWQSLEVAHGISFGYGYLTWEWRAGIRSYIYPLIFSCFYSLLNYFQLDDPLVLIYGPRILQALLSAYADLCFYQWCGAKKWAVFSITTSWFWFYTGSRTLINTFENALSTIALSKFPWLGKGKDENLKFIWIVAALSVIRPTAAVIWTPLCVYHLLITKYKISSLIITRYIPIALIVLAASTLLDSLSHGSFIVTPYEFLKFNIFQDVGSYYGSQPWFWYLSAGFPAILGIHFLPFVMATLVIIKNRSIHPNELALLGTIVFSLGVYSFLPHKEFRFLLPLLPIALFISSRFLSAWSRKASNVMLWTVALILFMGNVGPSYYLGYVHQRGTLDVMTPLREIALKNPNNTNLLFLMPCHSTPLFSHLHVNVTARFLTCEPNFNTSESYVDEADQFYSSPSVWLRKNYPPNGTLPSHIICFDSLEPMISDIMSRYKTTHEIPHTNFPSSRVGYNVLINERIGK
ncbi:GPI mannosyltransferase 3 [Tribolium madens]|uniref:GPI mannosyltransferase 3 n=1 Tax=Tribolium madens TaxID=41895 RepID=UPI001CF75C66|nr:GPI mannosyltransferase 3 [Tribolium madens]